MSDDAHAPGGCERAALAYLSIGWSVVPVQPRAKRPLVRWTPLQDAAPDRYAVEGWYRRWPDANVGIVTGAVSGLVVLDVDIGHGGDESLLRLEDEHGPLEPTLESLTGGGGRHLYFRHPGQEIGNKGGSRRAGPARRRRHGGGAAVDPSVRAPLWLARGPQAR